MAISIFAKPAKYQRTRTLPRKHLVRASSLIRGDQMSAYLGCKYNPTEGYENDTCIHVKPPNLENVKDGDWVDVMDGEHILPWLKERPGVNAIAFSDMTYGWYRPLIGNRMEVIPQHHCNFDREKRTREEVRTVGFIGGEIGFYFSVAEMQQLVERAGYEFKYVVNYRTREDVVAFYKEIDIQVVWAHRHPRKQARCPLKALNAASFGIPTVAYPLACYSEIEGHYLKTPTTADLVAELKHLKDPDYYKAVSWRLPLLAETYHISSIAEMYRQL